MIINMSESVDDKNFIRESLMKMIILKIVIILIINLIYWCKIYVRI